MRGQLNQIIGNATRYFEVSIRQRWLGMILKVGDDASIDPVGGRSLNFMRRISLYQNSARPFTGSVLRASVADGLTTKA